MENVDTLPKLVRNNYQKRGDGVAMAMKNFGLWQRYTWKDYYEKVKYFSLGLISLGLEPGDRVCLIGDNEPEWFWGEFAVQAARGIATGSFVDSTPSEVKYIADYGFDGKKPDLFWRALYQVANWFLFRPLKDKLGLSNAGSL